MERASGILLPISALPSPYGIGTLGAAAYEFADFLYAAGQSYWQVLPLGPTSYGDSPYQSFSTYAGNPYFVDPELLAEDGLLTRWELDDYDGASDPRHVDYGRIYETRFPLLERAKERGWDRDREEVDAFRAENASWLQDYALFMALKRKYGMKPWTEWPDEDIRLRAPGAVERALEELRADVELFIYIQFLFYRQWAKLKKYVNKLDIRIIGDLPIYVAPDSADVWAESHWFQLDEEGISTRVAGVPPDDFSEDGQVWGNTLYDYDAMARDGYGWWIRRVGGAAKLYDMIRIDHFRGFESYWAVPFGEKNARKGEWVKGPGMDLVGRLTGWFHNLDFIAEDLGFITPEVMELLEASGLPGMKVLELAFKPDKPGDYLPHKYTTNCVCYTGTHDNAPLLAWKDEVDPKELEFAKRYLGLNKTEGLNYGMIRGGMGSVAALFVAQMQDYLVLGADSRMNTPGIPHGNWTWRLLPGEADRKLAERIHELCRIYSRLTEARVEAEEAAAEAAKAAAEKAEGKKPKKSLAKITKKVEGAEAAPAEKEAPAGDAKE